jgi:glycerol-3-phosphate dehydrogenase (NAD(P)+)
MASVAIFGAGAFGTALAITLARAGHRVVLCVRRPAHLGELREARENRVYLPGALFPPELDLTGDWAAAAAAEALVMAVPSYFARAAIAPIMKAAPTDALLVSVTKGLERDSLMTMSQMLADLVPQASKIAVLSGPAFAAEIVQGRPAALVAAARDEGVAREAQELFAGRRLRIYRSLDVMGVELGGAVKNVIAIAAGISDGLELGSSARAGLITRGIAEMARLAHAAGARAETIAGLAGLGDLVLTCTGDRSRNRQLGLALARGAAPAPPAARAPVAEGVTNAATIRKLAERLKVEMPIVAAVHRVLYEGLAPGAMVEELLSRELKAEF